MRTIEEIKTDLSENNGMLLIQSVLTKEEKIKCLLKQIDLGNELIAAQDAEIARLRQQLEWQPIETAPRDGTVIEVVFKRFKCPILCYWRNWDEHQLHWEGKKPWAGWYSSRNERFHPSEAATLWRALPPLPQPQEGSPLDNPLTDEVYP